MRNFKKILIAVCVFALLVTGCVVWALAEEEEAPAVGTVEELVALVETAEKATEAEEKYTAVLAIADYLAAYELNTEEYAYTTAIVRTHKVAVDCARIYLDAVYADGVDDNTALDCIVKASELLNLFELPEETSGLAKAKELYNDALVQTANIFIGTIDANIETTLKTAKNQIAINKMSKLMSECSFYGDENPLAEVEVRFEELRAAHERAVAKNLAALDAANDAGNYDLPIYYEQSWENRPVGFNSTSLGEGWQVVYNGTSNLAGIAQEKNGNKYYVHRYVEKENPAGSYAQFGLSKCSSENGIVFEFDITTFGEIPEQGILLETGSINGVKFPNHYLFINNRGDLMPDNSGSTVFLEGALVKGEWLHIIIALDPEEFVYNLYVAGELIGTYDATCQGEKFDHNKVAFRLSGGPSTQGEICYDNILIYSGNTYRNHDRLANMTDEEKFCYFVDCFLNTSAPVLERKDNYDRATAFIGNYWIVSPETGEGAYADGVAENEALKNAVDAYNVFNIDEVVATAKAENLVSYVTLVEKLAEIERSYDSVSDRQKLINEISDFTKKYEGLIDTMIDIYPVTYETNSETGEVFEVKGNGVADYIEYNEIYNKVIIETTYDLNSDLFIKCIRRFENATTLSAMQRHYNRAKELIENDKIDLNIAADENSPLKDNFAELIAAYKTFKSSYKKVDSVTKENNSYKIVLCMKKISSYRTEEEWAANEEEVLEYINLVKRFIIETDAEGRLLYDPEFEGVKQAVSFFNDVYGYFYVIQQDEHVAYIESILTHVSETDSYIKKVGMISMLDRYLDTNEIDYTDARIAVLVSKIDTCKSELELRREDYAKTLIENANYFVRYVENMRTAKTYTEQKAYFEQAAVYYFSLDIQVEGAARAVETFDEFKAKFDIIEESTKQFMEAVTLYKASETEDEKYAALVECYRNAELVELSYEGATEAMTEYRAAYDAYMGYATAVNSDLANTGHAIGSLRSRSGITTIIAIVIKKIFGI